MLDVEGAIHAPATPRSRASRRLIPWVLAALDAVLIYAALLLAYWVRYSLKLGPTIQDQIPLDRYQPLAAMLLVIMMPSLFAKGAYRFRLSNELVDQMATVFSAATISVASIVVITAMTHQFEYSRGVVVYVWIFLIALLTVGRTLFRSIQGYCHRRGWGVHRLLVVGATNTGKMVMQSVTSRPDLGYHPVGFVERRDVSIIQDFGRFPALGTVADIPALVDRLQVDEIIIALPASAHEEVLDIVELCERTGVGLKLVPDLVETSLGKVQIDDLGGIPLLDIQDRPVRRMEKAAKRVLDVAVSVIWLVISTPLFLVAALLIKLESPGPILLWQERVGLEGQHFSCLKFRTMRDNADEMLELVQNQNEVGGPMFKMRNDPRQTRVGRWLRRWSLDELPQLWNVLRGEMSLVGPRPPLPHEVAQYESHHFRRLDAKPGMTGIWQVSGRSDLHFDEMVMMDLYYVENWSVILDIKILLRTVNAVLARKGAY